MIGILTFWGIPNCGTFAQAYALQKIISDIMPNEETYQLAYLNDIHKKFYELDCSTDERIEKRNELFKRVYSLIPNINIGCNKEFKNLQLEHLILGSDIIWDFNVPFFGSDPYLYGLGINSENKFSYAASFGTCKSSWNRIPSYVIEGLTKIDKISVRDVNSQIIIEKILNKKVSTVLDPVWLWDWNFDENIVTPNESNYIFVYGENFSLDYKKKIKQYAMKNNLIVIGYGTKEEDCSWCDKILNDYMITPFELIGYIKKANVIATNSFHGFNFGLYFHKKIVYYSSDFIDNKLKNLLSELEIDDLYLNSKDFDKMLAKQLDFQNIDKKISNKRKMSIEFLKKGLCIDNGF